MEHIYQINNNIKITEICSLFEEHFKKGYSFSGETHNFWECMYVIDGTVCVSGDERIYKLEGGEIIFHRPMEMHKFHVDDENGVKVLIFSFFAEGDLISFFEKKVFKLSQEQENVMKSFIEYMQKRWYDDENKDDSIQMYMKYFNTSKTYSQMIESYIIQLFLLLYDDSDSPDMLYTPETIAFKKAISIMNNHMSEGLSVDEIAAHCNVSVSSLKRIFNKYAGLSVHKYFLALKMKTAVELLKSGTSVTEISEKLGFANQSYFSAAFKRELGFSPTKYEK